MTYNIYENKLSEREKEVIDLIVLGYSNQEISNKIFTSYSRISIIITQLCDKYEIFDGERRVKLALARLKEMGVKF